MPNCVDLYDKVTKEIVDLAKLDDIICREVLNCEPHPKYYGGELGADWNNTILFYIAVSSECHLGSEKLRSKLMECRNDFEEGTEGRRVWDAIMKIHSWMEEKFTSRSYYSVKYKISMKDTIIFEGVPDFPTEYRILVYHGQIPSMAGFGTEPVTTIVVVTIKHSIIGIRGGDVKEYSLQELKDFYKTKLRSKNSRIKVWSLIKRLTERAKEEREYVAKQFE